MDDDHGIGFGLTVAAVTIFLAGVFWPLTLVCLVVGSIISFFDSKKFEREEAKKAKASREFVESIYGKDFRKYK